MHYCCEPHRRRHWLQGGHADECARMAAQMGRAPELAAFPFPWARLTCGPVPPAPPPPPGQGPGLSRGLGSASVPGSGSGLGPGALPEQGRGSSAAQPVAVAPEEADPWVDSSPRLPLCALLPGLLGTGGDSSEDEEVVAAGRAGGVPPEPQAEPAHADIGAGLSASGGANGANGSGSARYGSSGEGRSRGGGGCRASRGWRRICSCAAGGGGGGGTGLDGGAADSGVEWGCLQPPLLAEVRWPAASASAAPPGVQRRLRGPGPSEPAGTGGLPSHGQEWRDGHRDSSGGSGADGGDGGDGGDGDDGDGPSARWDESAWACRVWALPPHLTPPLRRPPRPSRGKRPEGQTWRRGPTAGPHSGSPVRRPGRRSDPGHADDAGRGDLGHQSERQLQRCQQRRQQVAGAPRVSEAATAPEAPEPAAGASGAAPPASGGSEPTAGVAAADGAAGGGGGRGGTGDHSISTSGGKGGRGGGDGDSDDGVGSSSGDSSDGGGGGGYGVSDWLSYYRWAGLPLESPAALLLHFPLTLYGVLRRLDERHGGALLRGTGGGAGGAASGGVSRLPYGRCWAVDVLYLGPQAELDLLDTFAALLPLLPPGLNLRISMVGPDVPYHMHGAVLSYDGARLRSIDSGGGGCGGPRSGGGGAPASSTGAAADAVATATVSNGRGGASPATVPAPAAPSAASDGPAAAAAAGGRGGDAAEAGLLHAAAPAAPAAAAAAPPPLVEVRLHSCLLHEASHLLTWARGRGPQQRRRALAGAAGPAEVAAAAAGGTAREVAMEAATAAAAAAAAAEAVNSAAAAEEEAEEEPPPLLVFAPNAGLPAYLSWLPTLQLLLLGWRRRRPNAGGAEAAAGARSIDGGGGAAAAGQEEEAAAAAPPAARGTGGGGDGQPLQLGRRLRPLSCVLFSAYNEEEVVRSVQLLTQLYGAVPEVALEVNPFRQPLRCVERIGNDLPSYSNGFLYGWYGPPPPPPPTVPPGRP